MNPQDTKVLEDILKKDAESLTDYEKAFINARESYLNNRQRADFASVLKGENAKPRVAPIQTQPAKTQFTNPEVQKPVEPKPADAGNNYSNTEGLDEEEA